ncbi:DUF928 domain-containing protein [Crocosphaera sp. UHCC 0190]|uniref:DUF928 domain-containing protein n=1 Tax=Crocosphaera sp. UHCC 0190 TaxID=3110246 RepID=UPI002B21D239|nr:DUF928 domain-containing protein [Crocosphaera sp. UHCC 0190]MEA5510235.1 DUF928 domain-containing protein [Crocosphaera sp. UHCC 0190]
MILNKRSIKKAATLLSVTLVTTLSLMDWVVMAQTQIPSNDQEESIANQVPDRRKGGASRRPQAQENAENEMAEAPQRRKPAASRPFNNQCDFDPQQLTALIPKNLVGATATNDPTLLFSVPAISTKTEIEFVLRGPQDELVQKKSFQGQGKEGIMSLQLPKVPLLSTANSQDKYHWYLSVICNADDRAYDVVVEGLLQPVQLDSNLVHQIDQATLAEQVNLYQDHQVWHETLKVLVELKRSQPQDSAILALWTDLLKSVDLDPVIGQKSLLEPQILTFNP